MKEMLDVYDANRQYIGVAERSVVHNAGLWHRTVHCYVAVNAASGERWMIFQRRARTLPSDAGKLYTTASGHVAAGESLEAAVMREIKQEIGIEMPADKTQHLFETTWVADIKRTDGTIFADRVWAHSFCAWFENVQINDIDFWRDFRFDDGEVDSLVAIRADDFKSVCAGLACEIPGIEWNGKNLCDAVVSAEEFAINGGETLYNKYQRLVDRITAK